MNYTWYFIFNSIEFEALRLVSRTYSLNLIGIGLVDILVTKGVYIGMTYNDVFLALGMNEKNPFEIDDHAIYTDEFGDVWLGVNPVEPT